MKQLLSPPFVWLLRLLSLSGVGIMAYLAWLHFSHGASSVCELGEGFSCEAVNTSIYSEILGVPVAFLGLGYFLFVLVLSFRKLSVGVWQFIFLATLFALIPSFYLTGTEIFIIGSICVFCELSKLLMVVILGLSFKSLKDEHKVPRQSSIFLVLAVGAIAALITWTIQSRTGQQEGYTELAQCMTENGVSAYDAFTCPVCAKQKQLFGKSFEYIKEIECDPRGQNSQPELCLEKSIQKTPTWIREIDGEEVGRLVGLQNAKKLAEFSGCEDTIIEN